MRSELRATGTKKSAKKEEIFCKQWTKICILQCKIKKNYGVLCKYICFIHTTRTAFKNSAQLYKQIRKCCIATVSSKNSVNCCFTPTHAHIHSFSSLSYDRSKASSKASCPHSAIQSFLFQMRVSSPFLRVIQQLPTTSSLSSCHFYPPFYLSFSNPL
jgi:hypothetical protein